MRRDVVALGNALVDLQARVKPALLAQAGVQPGFMTLVDAPTQKRVLGALEGAQVVMSSGGSAANTIAGIAEMGGTGAYVCKVGDDSHGRFYVEDLRRLGIAVAADRLAAGPTGTCVVLITPDAQRTMLTHLGVSGELAKEDVDPAVIRSASWLYVEGYLLPGEATRGAALEAIRIAQDAGVQVALTVSDPFCVRACHDLFWELISESVDLLFCNEAEGEALTGLDDPIEAAHAIHEKAASVALTYGARGSLLVHGGEVHPIEGIACNAVDTTGAGDMYAAGVLYGLTHGMTWPQAGRLASNAASKVVSRLGARLPGKLTPQEMRVLTA
jgi:sugar/nucleoside kinase (ribokinase family)